MSSAIVHAAVGALIGRAVLGADLDEWALLAVVTATIFPDIDSFFAIWFPGAHRTVLHNIFIVMIPAFLLFYLTHIRDTDFFERHWGPEGERVLWTCIVALAFGQIGLDLVESGVNLFWPLYDQFFQLTGILVFSTQGGLEQTFVGGGADLALGTTDDTYYTTPIDPADPVEEVDGAEIDIVLPVFSNGYELLLTALSILIVGQHIRRVRRQKTGRWFQTHPSD